MSGALQAVFQNQRSFGLAIGEAYQGGYYAGQISTSGNGIATHNLVASPKSSGESTAMTWNTGGGAGGVGSDIDGPANSAALNSATYPAAQFCEGLSIGGFTDWYLPAKNELEVVYYNLKPSANTNNTGSGINPNAVPARASNYTTSPSVPSQTSATDFQTGNTEAFDYASYWSSTEVSATYARYQGLDTGFQGSFSKTTSRRVRAVRRVAV